MDVVKNHRKQLAEYLTNKQKQTTVRSQETAVLPRVRTTRVPTSRKTAVKTNTGRLKTATIYDLPNEIVLKIFGYLSIGELLSVAQVCHLWHQLSSDNLLWKPLLQACVPSQTVSQQLGDLKSSNLKTSFMQRCIELRNKRVLRLLKKKNPYTGVIHCKDVENAFKFAGISWQIVMTDTSGNEHCLQNQDISYHLMSVSVRWFSLQMIAVSNVKKISLYSCNPLFHDSKTGKVVSNGPYQRSLLYSMDQKLSLALDKLKPVGSDENLKVFALEDGIIIGVWKEGGEIAFIAIASGLPGLVKKCIMGTASKMYQPPKEKIPACLPESTYGLYGYSCTIQLRTMKQEIWDQQFNNVECPNSNIRNGIAQFHLMKETDRQILQKELAFPWKTDAFKSKIKDVCCLDALLTDNEGQVVWNCSSAVSVKKEGSRKFTFDMDFDYCREQSRCIEYSDQKGQIFIQIDKDEDKTYITHIALSVLMEMLPTQGHDISSSGV